MKNTKNTLRPETETLRLNRALNVVLQCNRLINHSNNEADLFQGICETLVKIGGYRMVWVGGAEGGVDKRVVPLASFGFDNGYLEQAQITWADTDRGRGPTGTVNRPRFARHFPAS